MHRPNGDVFITLPERSWFNRKCRNLQPTATKLQQVFAAELSDVEFKIVDSTPVPVLKPYKGNNSPCFPRGKKTNYGYCASKKEYYYGAKLSLIMTPEGVITEVGIHAANTADINALRDMLSGMDITKLKLIGDKGYYDGELRATLKHQKGRLVVPDKKRHHRFKRNDTREGLFSSQVLRIGHSDIHYATHPPLINFDFLYTKSIV
jgi:IS5 family transposase